MSKVFPTIKESEARHLTGLIGSPIAHSLSPMIHKQAFAQFSMDTYDYILIEAKEDELNEAVDAIKEDGRFAGFNITMPGKTKILDYCDARLLGKTGKAVSGMKGQLFLRENRGRLDPEFDRYEAEIQAVLARE